MASSKVGGKDFFTNLDWGGRYFFCVAKWGGAERFFGPTNNVFSGWCAGKFWPMPYRGMVRSTTVSIKSELLKKTANIACSFILKLQL